MRERKGDKSSRVIKSKKELLLISREKMFNLMEERMGIKFFQILSLTRRKKQVFLELLGKLL